MSDRPDLRVQPTAATGATEPLQPSFSGRAGGSAEPPPRPGRKAEKEQPAASTGGQLRPTYANFVVDPETHDVVVHIHDASTDELIAQIPSAEVAALNKALRAYAE